MADIAENAPFTDPHAAISQGKRNLLVRDYSMAVTALAQACELLVEKHGETSDELGEPYLLYGRALLALAREEAGILGGGVPGSEEADGEDDIEEEDGNADEEKDDENDEEDEEAGVKKTNGAATDAEKETLANAESAIKPENKKSESTEEKTSETKSETTSVVVESSQADKKTETAIPKTEAESLQAGDEKPASSSGANEESAKDSRVKPDSTESKSNTESTDDTPASTSGENAAEVKENGTTSGSKDEDGEDVSKDEEEEDVNNLQLAWEILELAKLILLKRGPPGWKHLAEAHRLLGEVAMESGNHHGALIDLKGCLDLLAKVDPCDPRAIAETYYQLGLAHSMANEFDESINHFKEAASLLVSHIERLEDSKNAPKSEDPFYTVEGEIAELKELLPEIHEKIADMKDFKEEACKAMIEGIKNKAATISATNGAGPSSDGAGSSGASSTSGQSKPASDISHLVRKKRKADEIQPEASSPCKKPTP